MGRGLLFERWCLDRKTQCRKLFFMFFFCFYVQQLACEINERKQQRPKVAQEGKESKEENVWQKMNEKSKRTATYTTQCN